VAGEFLEVEHLFAESSDGLEDAALAAAGCATDHSELQLARDGCEILDDQPAIRLVAPVQLLCVPANPAQNVGHRAAALAATPANDQGSPILRMFEKTSAQMAGNVFGDMGGADLPGCEGRNLLVKRADFDPLLVVEDRTVDRARDVVFGKLGRRANVDDFIKGRKLADPPDGSDVMFHARNASC
jgi:hypothetical protein